MLTRRLVSQSRALPVSSYSIRSFTTSQAPQESHPKYPRSPSLADVTPNGSAKFEYLQKQFRDKTAAEMKAREQKDSQFHAYGSITRLPLSPAYAHGASNASSGSNGSSATDSSQPMAVGSLFTDDTGSKSESESSKRKGPFSSLIYGTDEGQKMDQEIEKSFSQVLARGKYVHSIVFHQVKPNKVDEYADLVGKWYPRMAAMPENKVNLVGSWRTEVGDCDTFVHIWEYQRYHGYHASLHSINSHPDFPDFDHKLKDLIVSKNTSLMQEFSFWPTTSPRKLGGLFELRSYTLHPGNLLEWETHWRRGLKARREVMEGVGAWFVQIGELNTVHHLWQFADLEERKLRRERSWGVEGWGETVHKTVPLIQTMKSRILIPMPWSPVA